ncbi:hypothetical protein ASPZODRAFT_134988 [Penicilliopsis zonata CBS 506.65]|uniref:Septin-type G domain-containing protein n=1 Tax=Penicilliopsis zonata CBS 506.65 TaxID=1073090 RepID=A0A1L9SAQ9_9EURO|nr:hypothetical protein ASPZODRAFT_134988 [Penicilliopsis zonata CBS 506.65]OJJ44207.1 hypothetical protein ASPZODRAFT_134988 [Penicilliopsis zonata CBS 506.65]
MSAARTRSPGRVPPSSDAHLSVADNGSSGQRRASFGFLRRSKSTEPLAERKASGGRGKKMTKEQAREEELRRQREMASKPRQPPRLPALAPAPQLETFGGDERPDGEVVSSPSHAIPSPARVAPPIPLPEDAVEFYSRTESMTHRGRYSYASSSAVSTVNGPRRLRRRKDPTPYNILVIGARNSGKTSFLNFLRSSLTLPPHKHPSRAPSEFEELDRQSPANDGFTSRYLETEIDGERVGLTLWDSQGLEKNIVDIQLRSVTGFLESKFEETLTEEMKVIRSPGTRDTHIHCTFLILDPVRLDANAAAAERAANGAPLPSDSRITGILDDNLDIQVLRTMLGKTTIVPVISKADTVTTAHMAYLKKAVWDSLKKANIDPLEILTLEEQEDSAIESDEDEYDNNDDDEGDDSEAAAEKAGAVTPTSTYSDDDVPEPVSPSRRSQSTRKSSGSVTSSSIIPFSILSPDPHSLAAGDEPVGRKFPWGFADPHNPVHCDFVKLKDSVFSEWRSELREASRVVWYERWRTNRLNRNGHAPAQAPPQKKKAYGGRNGPVKDGRRTR